VSLHPTPDEVRAAVAAALAEDLLADGDLTAALLDPAAMTNAGIVTREEGVLAGERCAIEAFRAVDAAVAVEFLRHDGDRLLAGDTIATVTGPMRSIVSAERTALNFLGHLSGIATATRELVEAVSAVDPGVCVLDTRKTTPGLRALEKAAVRAGGGVNHRSSLSEFVLIKDNHLGAITIADAVARALELWPGRTVEVECDTPGQVDAAVAAGATAVLLDNMSPEEAAQCVARVHAADEDVFVEASGGITIETAAQYARAGVDGMSSGALTHTVRSLDLGLDLFEG
jgi:nicotinate-nucleotide pyrophosphorylase (carboxylating)